MGFRSFHNNSGFYLRNSTGKSGTVCVQLQSDSGKGMTFP
jgi:hypothetical protein